MISSKTTQELQQSLAVIWDVDGTLLDTAELHFAAWKRLADELGKPFSREAFKATFGRRNPEIIHLLFEERYSDAEVAALGARKETYYREAAKSGLTLLPGARELLNELHRAGFRQAVGSSAPRENLDLVLRLTGTTDLFQAVVAMEDTHRGKPDPEVFLVAAERLRVSPSRCLVCEDAVAGVEAARAGGMKCIAIAAVGHHSPDRLRAAGADRVIATWQEVTAAQIRELLAADLPALLDGATAAPDRQ